jgi:putative pyruvate formate lyase activating enzyme
MPDAEADTEAILRFLAEEISPDTYVNVMDQYRPCGAGYDDEFINRRLHSGEFSSAMDAANKAGLKRLDSRDRMRLFFQL